VPDYPHTRYADPAGISAPSSTSSERVAGSGEGQQYAEGDSSTRASLAVPVQGVAVAPAKSAGLIWLEQYLLFQAESSALRADYLYARDSYDYIRLEELAERWLQVTSRIVNTEEFGGGEFYPLREQQLAVSRNWRDHLVTLARVRRLGGDRLLLAHAEFHLVFAEAVEAQLPRHYRP
jgi:hypothetical protein